MSVHAGPADWWTDATDSGRIHMATKGIVQSGLVLNLDAGASTSYPGSGTTWTDLSGNGRTGTLTNGPTFNSANGGSIVFDGVNDTVFVAGSSILTAATFVVWLRRNGSQPNYTGIFFSRSTDITGIGFLGTTNKLSYHWNGTAATYSFDSGLTVPDLAWCMCAVSVTSTAAILYLCQSSGISSATNTTTHNQTTLNNLKVGEDDLGGSDRQMTGNISQALLYNRALSEAEIQQNFNAMRGRFGI